MALLYMASDRLQNFKIFRGKFVEKKTLEFCGKFPDIFRANLAEKCLVKISRFCANFLDIFHWKVIGFALI